MFMYIVKLFLNFETKMTIKNVPNSILFLQVRKQSKRTNNFQLDNTWPHNMDSKMTN